MRAGCTDAISRQGRILVTNGGWGNSSKTRVGDKGKRAEQVGKKSHHHLTTHLPAYPSTTMKHPFNAERQRTRSTCRTSLLASHPKSGRQGSEGKCRERDSQSRPTCSLFGAHGQRIPTCNQMLSPRGPKRLDGGQERQLCRTKGQTSRRLPTRNPN
jgi:hypothetical protein